MTPTKSAPGDLGSDFGVAAWRDGGRPSESDRTARSRTDRGQHLPGCATRRGPPTRVRRPGRRPGTGGGGTHGRRARSPRPLAARLLPAPRRSERADPVRGRSAARRPQLHDPPRRRDPARSPDLQPAGQFSQRRARPRSSPQRPRRRAAAGVAARLQDTDGAPSRPDRRLVPPAAADRHAVCAARPCLRTGRQVRRPARVAAGRRSAPRRSGAARLHRHLRQRHDPARHRTATVRDVVVPGPTDDGQPRPRDVVPPVVPGRRMAAVPPAGDLELVGARPVGRIDLHIATASWSSTWCKKA